MTAATLDPATAIELALSEVRDRLRDLADNASDEHLLDELRSLLRSAGGKIRRATKRTEPKPPKPAAPEQPVQRTASPAVKPAQTAAASPKEKPVEPSRTVAKEQTGPARVSARVERQSVKEPVKPPTVASSRPADRPAPAKADPSARTTTPGVHAKRRLPRWLALVVLVLVVAVIAAVNVTACIAVASVGAILAGARLGWRALRELRRRPT